MHTAKWRRREYQPAPSRPSREITDSLFSSSHAGAPGHAGPQIETEITGSVTRMQLRRSRVGFALDRAHDYDLLFLRALQKELEPLLRDFRPDVVQNHRTERCWDSGRLAGAQAQKFRWRPTWQTICHQYARMRASAELSFLPEAWSGRVAPACGALELAAVMRFLQIPRLLFATNQDLSAC